MTVTPEEIARLTALCEKATPGPWFKKVEHDPEDGFYLWATPNLHTVIGGEMSEKNCDFIAAARTALPALLSSLTTAREEIERLKRDAERAAA